MKDHLLNSRASVFLDEDDLGPYFTCWLPEIDGKTASIMIRQSSVDGGVIIIMTEPGDDFDIFWNADTLGESGQFRAYHNSHPLPKDPR